MKSLPISCWAAEDIPTNRAEKIGYEGLTNAELLSIIIGSGSDGLNAIDTARMILNSCDNNLNSLARTKERDLLHLKGMGRIKVARIMAAIELGRRRNGENLIDKPRLSSAARIYNHYKHLEDNETEEFWISLLNQDFSLIKDIRISYGGLTETLADVRIIMRECVINNATILTCVHNHPSGSIQPSKADDALTLSIEKACMVMRIKLLDHVIIGQGAYFSYHENGNI